MRISQEERRPIHVAATSDGEPRLRAEHVDLALRALERRSPATPFGGRGGRCQPLEPQGFPETVGA